MVYSELKDKVAVVTGGSKGIGTAISERFGKEGMKVVINYHSDQKGAQEAADAVKKNGGDAAVENFGDLDIWVNNATKDMSLEDWNKVIKVNLSGVFLGTNMALRYFTDHKKRKTLLTCLVFMNKFHGQRLHITSQVKVESRCSLKLLRWNMLSKISV